MTEVPGAGPFDTRGGNVFREPQLCGEERFVPAVGPLILRPTDLFRSVRRKVGAVSLIFRGPGG